jgi:hypothetical protein
METTKPLVIHVRCSEKQYQMIEAASEDLGMKLTEFIRYVMIRWFEEKWPGPKVTLTPDELAQVQEESLPQEE